MHTHILQIVCDFKAFISSEISILKFLLDNFMLWVIQKLYYWYNYIIIEFYYYMKNIEMCDSKYLCIWLIESMVPLLYINVNNVIVKLQVFCTWFSKFQRIIIQEKVTISGNSLLQEFGYLPDKISVVIVCWALLMTKCVFAFFRGYSSIFVIIKK